MDHHAVPRSETAPELVISYKSLAEPGVPYKRGMGESARHIMTALGDISAAKVPVRDVDALLTTVSKAGGSPRNVNKHRPVVLAIFNYGIKSPRSGCRATRQLLRTGAGKRSPASVPYNPRSLSSRRPWRPISLDVYRPCAVPQPGA